jgi:hypothetical protein
VQAIAMEATGVYWKPVWNIWEAEKKFQLLLVNAQHVKRVPGRKTDQKDSEWIGELLQHGLLRASFVPPVEIRQLRDLTRMRARIRQTLASFANRIQKVLEDANLKLGSVASDVLGVSGRHMLKALMAGEQDPQKLANLAQGHLVGVGIAIARDPLHRSGRAQLAHPAPTSSESAKARERGRLTDTGRRKPPSDVPSHAAPREAMPLTAASQGLPPQTAYRHAKGPKRWSVHGHAIILEVPRQNRAQVGSLFLKGRVHALPQFLSQGPQLGLPPLAHRLSQNREMSLPRLPTTVGKP